MDILRRQSRLLLSLALLGVLSFAFVPQAHARRAASLTTDLNYGVSCTTEVLIVDLGIVPSSFDTYHTVRCNRVVGRLQINAAQTNDAAQRYYPATSTCYNTSSCSSYIELKPYAEGEWLLTTSAHVGTATDPFYYGIANTVYLASQCDYPICGDGYIPD